MSAPDEPKLSFKVHKYGKTRDVHMSGKLSNDGQQDRTKTDLKDFQKNFRLQLKPEQSQVTGSQKQSSTLQIPPGKSKNTQPKGRKRRPFLVRKFEDAYELTDQLLGRGARSSVMVCCHRNTSAQYAVKIIPQSDDNEIRKRVLREIEILYVGRAHRNILHLIEYFEEKNNFYLVFNKMEGGPLFQRIKKQRSFTEQEACTVVRELALALIFLHGKNIAHRDLKPANILCEKVDEVTPVRICDFDLSHISQQRTPTTPILMTPVGSAEYMAPEVVQAYTGDSFTYDKKCDLWSLGVVLYMMLSGDVPFKGRCGRKCGWEQGKHCDHCQDLLLDNIQTGSYYFTGKEWGEISEPAMDLVAHLLARNPDERYSAAKVLEHEWITMEAPPTPLTTPTVLKRNSSFPQGLSQYASMANSLTRQLSISHSRPPSLDITKHQQLLEDDGNRYMSLSPPSSSELVLRRRGNTPERQS